MSFLQGEKVVVTNCFTKNEVCTIVNINYDIEDNISTYVLTNDVTGEMFEATEDTMRKHQTNCINKK